MVVLLIVEYVTVIIWIMLQSLTVGQGKAVTGGE